MSKKPKRTLNEAEISARSAGGKRRAQVLSPDERKKIAQRGGLTKAKNAARKKALSEKRRAAVLARWNQEKKR
ncbi:MAG: hypothetical protein AAF927_02225 [Bacteroidota bacterium]